MPAPLPNTRPAPLPAQRGIPTPPNAAPAVKRTVSFGKAPLNQGYRVALYGTGGIGKSTLAQLMPGPVAYFDIENRIGKLGQRDNVQVVNGINTYTDLLDNLGADGYDDMRSIVIDSGTRTEDMIVEHIRTIRPKNDKGMPVNSIEDYGYKTGYTYVYEEFIKLLPLLDKHIAAGRNVLIVCHDCTCRAVNPKGEDFIRYEPRLTSPDRAPQFSIRLKLKEWVDFLLFYSYDVDVTKGKGQGGGTRAIQCNELPYCMAKSITAHGEIVIPDANFNVWPQLGVK